MTHVKNADLLAEVIQSKQAGTPTPRLMAMFTCMVDGWARKSNWIGYDDADKSDWKQEALLMLWRRWDRFDETPKKTPDGRTKPPNPFAYYGQFINFAFIEGVRTRNKQKERRDDLFIQLGAYGSADRAATARWQAGVAEIQEERADEQYRRDIRVRGRPGRPKSK